MGVVIGSIARSTPEPSSDRSSPSTFSLTPASATSAAPTTAAPPVMVARPRTDPRDFHAGMSLVIYGNTSDLGRKAGPLLDRLADLRVNSLSVTFPLYQRSWTASAVEADPATTPSPENLESLVRSAHQRRFTVMLRPIIDEQALIGDGQWRGSIRPANVSAWFESYTRLALLYATFAQREAVEIFCVATELVSLEQQEQEWISLIAQVRSVFHGQVTYCANWDSFARAPFWNAVDFVGIDGFFPLSAPASATTEQLAVAWQPWVRRIEEFKRIVDKPIVLTEQGVTSQEGSHRQPWLWDQKTPIDVETQSRYYRATCDAMAKLVSGLYWWAVDLELPNTGTVDGGYSPLGKPAESEVRRCFS